MNLTSRSLLDLNMNLILRSLLDLNMNIPAELSQFAFAFGMKLTELMIETAF